MISFLRGGDFMCARLEKIRPVENQRRFYAMRTSQTLLVDLCLTRECGRIGSAGQILIEYTKTQNDAEKALNKLAAHKRCPGYQLQELLQLKLRD